MDPEAKFRRATARLRGSLVVPHQTDGVRWAMQREDRRDPRGGILADEPGMGKTIMTLALVLGDERPTDRTLIFAPKSVVPQWLSEIQRFTDLQALAASKTDGSARPGEPFQVAVACYSVLQRSHDRSHWIFGEQWHRVVADEGHVMRNPRTQIYAGLAALRAACKWALTGTPVQNSIEDVISIAKWLGAPPMPKKTFTARGYILRRRLCDLPRSPLPPLVIRHERLQFGREEERLLYQRVEDACRRKVARAMRSNNQMDIFEAIMRCRQVCSHPQIYLDAVRCCGRGADALDEDALPAAWEGGATKMDALAGIVSATLGTGDKSIVFCCFVKEMVTYDRHLREAVGVQTFLFHGQMNDAERSASIAGFRDTALPAVMLAQINAGGCGLNLQWANRVYVLSPNYNPTLEIQALGRVFRHGQAKPVVFTRLIMSDTVEDRICEIQEKKLALISEVLNDPDIKRRLSEMNLHLTNQIVRQIFNGTVAS